MTVKQKKNTVAERLGCQERRTRLHISEKGGWRQIHVTCNKQN